MNEEEINAKELNEKWELSQVVKNAIKQSQEKDSPQQTGAIKAVLRNEITWIIFIGGAIWSSVVWIVLPLQRVQIQQEQMQIILATIQTNNNQVLEEHQVLGNRVTKLETEIVNLMK